jgi:hypothetical protein
MWEPVRLTTVWASRACYMDSFTFLSSNFFRNPFPPRLVWIIYQAMRTHRGAEIQLHASSRHWKDARSELPSTERTPGTHWIGRWVGPTVGLEAVEQTKRSSSFRETNRNPSLVQSAVTDWAIPCTLYYYSPAGNIEVIICCRRVRICGSCNDAVIIEFTWRQKLGSVMDNEFERIWKEMILALSRCSSCIFCMDWGNPRKPYL